MINFWLASFWHDPNQAWCSRRALCAIGLCHFLNTGHIRWKSGSSVKVSILSKYKRRHKRFVAWLKEEKQKNERVRKALTGTSVPRLTLWIYANFKVRLQPSLVLQLPPGASQQMANEKAKLTTTTFFLR